MHPSTDRLHRTSELFRTLNLPDRFDRPHVFKANGLERAEKCHLHYHTTSLNYGKYPPNVNTVPVFYYGLNTRFTNRQQIGGMFRNFSLNTAVDRDC